MLKRESRLISNYEYNKTRRMGTSCSGKYSHVFYLDTKKPQNPARVGIVVTNKFDKSAVRRNRVKRIYREILRKEYERIPSGFWVVVYPKGEFLKAPYEEISADLIEILQKIFVSK